MRFRIMRIINYTLVRVGLGPIWIRQDMQTGRMWAGRWEMPS